jgi:hypothetical protein
MQHYYFRRLINVAFWKKIVRGEFDAKNAVLSLAQILLRASMVRTDPAARSSVATLPDRMAEGLKRFNGAVLLILAGNDLTAQEFSDSTSSSRIWRELLSRPQVTRQFLPEANHTFSSRDWRDQVAVWTRQWISSW